MNHDIDDLLDLIRKLELRILELEKCTHHRDGAIPNDSYYWEHG